MLATNTGDSSWWRLWLASALCFCLSASAQNVLECSLAPGQQVSYGEGKIYTVIRPLSAGPPKDGAVYECGGAFNSERVALRVFKEINGDIFKEAITLKMFSWASNVSTDLAPTLKNVFAYGGHVFTVLPMFGKSMEAVLHGSQETFPCPTAMHIARQLINKTREAHSFQLLNLSIEPRHVVAVDPEQADVSYFTTQYPIHILDWRRSQLPGPVKQLPSDQRFTPPELLVYGPASRASDIWQIGATLLSLLTGWCSDIEDGACEKTTPESIQTYLLQAKGVAPKSRLPISELIAHMMAPNPQDRISLELALSHEGLLC